MCSAHTLNKGQQSTKEACPPLLGVQREPHDGQQCGAARGLEDLCGCGGRSVHVYKCFVVAAVQLLSCVRLFVTPWTAACQAPLRIGVGCHARLQGIFPTQGSNPGLPRCRRILYHLSHQGIFVHGHIPKALNWPGI